MTTCLITRTQPGAQVSEAHVRAIGHKAIVVPAAVIIPTHAAIDGNGVQALLMTSAAAARHVVMTPALAALPVYAVGDATAEAATIAGFRTVISAGGDGATLAVLAADRMKTDAGALLHVRGTEVAGDVTGMLTACGFETRFIEIYDTRDHPDFKQNIVQHLRQEVGPKPGPKPGPERGIVLFHSPAGARRLGQAIDGLDLDLRAWLAIGLSPACLIPAQNKGFGDLIAAVQPDEMALMEAVRLHATHSGT
jgi:uroporphyrinogen-III synthase